MRSEDYEYRVVDRSLLAPILRRLIWEPLLSHIPRSTSANDLSLLGAAFAVLSLVVLMCHPAGLGLVLGAACILISVNLDYLDGMQARRLGTSGPLGEYVDHWLDSLAAAAVLWGLAIVYEAGPTATLALLALGLIAYTGAFWIHKECGSLELDAIGTLETSFIQAGIYLCIARLGRDWFGSPLIGPFSIFDLLLGYTLLSYARLVGASLSRKADGTIGLWLPILQILLAAAWALIASVSAPIGCVVVILTGIIVNGELVAARVEQRRAASFDSTVLVSLVVSLALLSLPRLFHEILGLGLAVVLGARTLFTFRAVVRRQSDDLGEHEILRRLI